MFDFVTFPCDFSFCHFSTFPILISVFLHFGAVKYLGNIKTGKTAFITESLTVDNTLQGKKNVEFLTPNECLLQLFDLSQTSLSFALHYDYFSFFPSETEKDDRETACTLRSQINAYFFRKKFLSPLSGPSSPPPLLIFFTFPEKTLKKIKLLRSKHFN